MTTDMTKGSPVRLILAFMVPVWIGNIFQQFYNVVDSVIVGRFLGVNALAAVGSTGSVVFLVMGLVNGITSGFSVLLAQCFGAKDYKKLRYYECVAGILCAGIAVFLTMFLVFATEPILRLMKTPDEIFDDTKAYLVVIFAGVAVTALYNMLAGMLRALGDSKTPLIF